MVFLIAREIYINTVRKYIDKPLIKVITGMRRVGKSYFLLQIQDLLRKRGILDEQILSINKDSLEYDSIKSYQDLYDYVNKFLGKVKGPKYLFVDEIQEIEEWEKAIGSFFREGEIDIYITGSNAHLLSSDLATLLSGRYIEFSIYSLSFSEYLLFNGIDVSESTVAFNKYLKYGGLPVLSLLDDNEDVIYQYLGSLYDTILLRDVMSRHQIRNINLLKNITRFIFDNVGSTFSAKRISDYLKSQQAEVGVNTIQNYIDHLTATFILYKVERYDIKGKRLLEYYEKYYLGDVGLRHALLGYREADISGILENMVFLELKRRGYEVFIGKLDQREVDFIATKANKKIYVQVAYMLGSQETVEREFSVLVQIPDNYPKYVLSMDTIFGGDYQGIKRINLIDFLLMKEGEW